MITIYVGFDPREEIVYHTCVSSIIHNSTVPIQITPLSLNHLHNTYNESHNDGSNQFIYSRFLVPHLNNYKGYSIFIDGDMIVNDCMSNLINSINKTKAVSVVKHDYKTKYHTKYWNQPNESYPRKNWSSVIVWNNTHPKNNILTPRFISMSSGKYLHRFSWLDDEDIGTLDPKWNWLVGEYDNNNRASIYHYTLGAPCFDGFAQYGHSDIWFKYFDTANNVDQ